MANQGGSREPHQRSGQQDHKNDDMKRGAQQGGGSKSGQQSAEEFASKQAGQRSGSGNDPHKASETARKGGRS